MSHKVVAKIPKALYKESLQKQTQILGKTLVILIGKAIDDEIIFQNQMRHVVKPHHADIAIISDYNNRKNENIYKHFISNLLRLRNWFNFTRSRLEFFISMF